MYPNQFKILPTTTLSCSSTTKILVPLQMPLSQAKFQMSITMHPILSFSACNGSPGKSCLISSMSIELLQVFWFLDLKFFKIVKQLLSNTLMDKANEILRKSDAFDKFLILDDGFTIFQRLETDENKNASTI